jgi:hypothetical protein
MFRKSGFLAVQAIIKVLIHSCEVPIISHPSFHNYHECLIKFHCPALTKQAVGSLRSEVAHILGLSETVMVSAGSGDNACSALGLGITR